MGLASGEPGSGRTKYWDSVSTVVEHAGALFHDVTKNKSYITLTSRYQHTSLGRVSSLPQPLLSVTTIPCGPLTSHFPPFYICYRHSHSHLYRHPRRIYGMNYCLYLDTRRFTQYARRLKVFGAATGARTSSHQFSDGRIRRPNRTI